MPDRKIFLAFAAITGFAILYVLFLVSQQVMPSNWVYSETFEENWMKPEYNATHWKPIQLPFLEMGKRNLPAYYRGEIELLGIIKPDITIGVRDKILGVYVNGDEIKKYKTIPSRDPLQQGEEIVLSTSLFKPGKNLLAVKIEGGEYRIIGINTQIVTLENSKVLALFFLMPTLLFLVLGKKSLDSNKTALIVFLILTLIFLKPIFQDFNYWGSRDWDFTQGFNAVPKETILHFHQIPLWNPYDGGGQPMLADPQSMWMSLLFPIIFIFNVITGLKIQIILWYVIGLFGMYLLGKQLKLNTYACYLMAFTLMFSSVYSLRMTVGYVIVHSISLLAWTFLFYLKALENKKYAILSALTMAFMMFEGGIYNLVYTTMFLTLYALLTSAKKLLEKKTKKDIINPITTLLIAFILCSTLSAVKALPMVEFSMKYPRLTEQCDLDNSLYTGYKIDYLYHAFLGSTQRHFVLVSEAALNIWDNFGAYIGPIAVLLAVGGILLYFKREWPLALIILFGIVLSFGNGKSEMVLWAFLHKFPIFSSLRYASRLILIAFFPITIFAGYMTSKIENKRGWIAMILTVLVFYNLLLVDSPTLDEAFTMAPRDIVETKFTQVVERPETLYVYSESYKHFLQNQGVVNFYGSLARLSCLTPSPIPAGDLKYRGEVFLKSGNGNASFKSFSPNRLVIEVNAENPDILIINQGYDKGWKTTAGNIFPEDGLIAINVSSKNKEVILYYSPLSFKIGLLITLLTILLLLHYHKYKKEKINLKKYFKTLKNKQVIYSAILIALISFYGVDFIQASGLYTENQILLYGPEYNIPGTIKSGMWLAAELGHDFGHMGSDGSWETEYGGYGYLISGPYVNIQEGAYNIHFRIKINNNTIQDDNKVVTIELASNKGRTVTAKDLYIKDFKRSNTYQEFTLEINTTKPLTDVEFRVHYANSPATVNVEKITLKPMNE